MGPSKRDNMLGYLGAQLVKHPTLDPGSGHDIKPCAVLCTQPGNLLEILYLALLLPLPAL